MGQKQASLLMFYLSKIYVFINNIREKSIILKLLFTFNLTFESPLPFTKATGYFLRNDRAKCVDLRIILSE